MIFLYNTLFFIVIFLGFPVMVPIMLVSKKRRKTFLQRLGLTPLPEEITGGKLFRSEKKRIWVHALSVGEVLSAVSLVKRLKKCPNTINVVFSASTKTGFDIAGLYLKDFVNAIFYFPYDLLFSLKHIVKKIDPSVVVIVETDIWPNFLFEMKRRDVPVILVNARLSKKSFIGYKRFRFFINQVFSCFADICAQSLEDFRRFRNLDVSPDRITITGNIKFDEEYRMVTSNEIESIKQSMHIQHFQKVLLAGSTHQGEESIILDAYSRIKKHLNDLVLIVAPRNPERAGSIYRIFQTSGFSAILMKELKKVPSDKQFDVIIVDTLGLLKRLYAIADIAFVGGSLVNCGGHNPLEPAAFSKPIIFGHDMSDFEDISKMLLKKGGAIRVKDALSFSKAVALLIERNGKAREMGRNSFQVFNTNKGAVEKTMKVIKAYLC